MADQVKRDVVGGESGMYVGEEKVQKMLRKSEVNRTLGESRHKWEDKINLKSSVYSADMNVLGWAGSGY